MVGGQGGTVDGALSITPQKTRHYLLTSIIEAHGNWGDDFEKIVSEQIKHQIQRIGGGRMGYAKLKVISMLIVRGSKENG